MDPLILDARAATYRYPGRTEAAVESVDLTVAAGEMVAVVGPNGSGKTTLLRMLLGVLHPERGTVSVAGRPVTSWTRRELARLVGVVVQREEPVFPLRVRQTVVLGRYPHLPALGVPRAADDAAVERALARCDVTHLADRWVATLSGGEWQRVRIARALAQEPRALVLDEATANLDLRHEMEVFELAAELARAEHLGLLVVTHHVNLAARFADRIMVLDRGSPRAVGRPGDVLTREVLEQVFAWPVEMFEWDGSPQLVPRRRSDPHR